MENAMLVGFGVDVHRIDASRPLFLGGIEIKDAPGLVGHSDADILLHVIIDACLGASGLGDIGAHFPDTDPKWKGVKSSFMLRHVLTLLEQQALKVANIDTTVMTEAPKLRPWIDQIRTSISELMQLDLRRVSVKATTSEKMGFVGTGEGMQAFAVVLLEHVSS
jgi:2-C-methyl-D-erythritol 2,4-cyclodiphosphate synthase